MAAPNIVNIQTLTGTTTVASLSSTNTTAILSNLVGSNTVLKINTVIASNISTSVPCTVSIFYNTGSAGTGTNYALTSSISVPASSTLISLDKSTTIYLPENTSLVAQAGTANLINLVISYEIIS